MWRYKIWADTEDSAKRIASFLTKNVTNFQFRDSKTEKYTFWSIHPHTDLTKIRRYCTVIIVYRNFNRRYEIQIIKGVKNGKRINKTEG